LRQWREKGDAEAFQRLMSRHTGMVYGTCRRILGDSTAAEDATQACFLKLAEVPAAIKTSLPGWLHAVATRCALEMLRSDKRRTTREQRYAEQLPSVIEPDWDDIKPLIDEALGALPDKLKFPIIRHFYEGESHAAIARELSISRAAVSLRIKRGVALLRKGLRKRGVEIAAPVLSALLSANLACAVPTSVLAALGAIALKGPPATVFVASGTALTLGGAFWAVSIFFFIAAGAFVGFRAYQGEDRPAIEAVAQEEGTPAPMASRPPSPPGPEVQRETIPAPPATDMEPPVESARSVASTADVPETSIQYPEAFRGGPPLDYWSPALESEDSRFEEPAILSRELRLISRGKPVSSSNTEYTRTGLRRLNDGVKDYGPENVVTLPPGPQWVQIHLESLSEVRTIVIWHCFQEKRVYFDVVVQLGVEADGSDGRVVFNNDFDNSLGQGAGGQGEYVESNRGRRIEAGGARGRYVRCFSNGNSANLENHYIEVEVWGIPLE
jgi:RNA polymerase sigma factor (sigma-70 family)